MEIDYLKPRYTLRQAADAAAFPLNTLRSNYQRGWFKSFASDASVGKGHTRLLCLGDILALAIASRLTELRIRPFEAWNAAYLFGVVAVLKKGGPKRRPFELFDDRSYATVLIWRPEYPPEILPIDVQRNALDLAALGSGGGASTLQVGAIVLPLNSIEFAVFDQLGITKPSRIGP